LQCPVPEHAALHDSPHELLQPRALVHATWQLFSQVDWHKPSPEHAHAPVVHAHNVAPVHDGGPPGPAGAQAPSATAEANSATSANGIRMGRMLSISRFRVDAL
jgi:hypothetical protein